MSPAKRRRIAGESGPAGKVDQPIEEPVEVDEAVIEETETPEAVEEMLEADSVEDELVEEAADEPEVSDDIVDEVVDEPVTPKKPAVPTAKKKAVAEDVSEVATRERRPGSSQALVGAIAAFALLAGGIFVCWWGYNKATDERHSAAALDAAAIGVETIFTYNFEALDAHRDEAVKLMTDKYQAEFEKILPTLDESAPQRQVIAQAVIRGVATMPCGKDCSPDKAKVLVFYDQARLADGESQTAVFGQRITVDLVKDGDRWLIDDIGAL